MNWSGSRGGICHHYWDVIRAWVILNAAGGAGDLGVPLDDHIAIVLEAMQGISEDLGLWEDCFGPMRKSCAAAQESVSLHNHARKRTAEKADGEGLLPVMRPGAGPFLSPLFQNPR